MIKTKKKNYFFLVFAFFFAAGLAFTVFAAVFPFAALFFVTGFFSNSPTNRLHLYAALSFAMSAAGVFADPGTVSAYATIKENAAETSYGDDGTFILVSQNHASLSSDYCRHVIGEVPDMPETVRESVRPVELKGQIISTADELKQMIQKFC